MRKRLVIAGTVVAACGALAVSGVLTSANAAPAAPAPPVALAAAPVSPPPTRAAEPEHEVLGEVISSGLGDLVFYGVKLREPRLPQTTFGIMAGTRAGEDLVIANETSGSDKAPGFHAVTGGLNANGHDVPTFGYYVGPAAKITSSAGVAHQARWSADPNVVVFWFNLGTPDPARLKAYDAAGNKLPGGNTGVGHG
ncbi:hypothetical protein Amsp01_026430 [Amycolatopsis sp. NBRC 101858]|uniref:hypothetical protein n=1 Tax=Amycolatopsis sp. NBRC 101858 TaxID=3032200 RepID=UPI0024A2D044|nr:hypothetical protein [Amycolatopsis sp. NBRC 101858]GLY36619.1 hypothetical protein Amsp01_026430 [Amycolatopsis sp. NBRC 101858]